MLVLEATAASESAFTPAGSLAPEAFKCGRVLDYSALEPGDLILSCDEEPDWVSHSIQKVQYSLLPDSQHTRFTHAMMYLGAGLVLEATFEFKKPNTGLASTARLTAMILGVDVDPPPGVLDQRTRLHGVFIEHLWRYSAHYSLRARRLNRLLGQPVAQQELVGNALSLFAFDYDFEFVRNLGFNAMFPNAQPIEGWPRETQTAPVVCSTFYARAHDMTFLGEGLTENVGYCTPSFLSSNSAFTDLQLSWAKLGDSH